MRINARLDEQAREQIDYLAQTTGQSVSQVVRESVAHYYVEVRARQTGPKHLLALAGKGRSGRSDVASNVKREVGLALDAKRGAPGKPLGKPSGGAPGA